MAEIQLERIGRQELSIDVKGNHATAKLLGSFTAAVKGRDGKPHTMAGGGKATDHWVNQNGKWLIEMEEMIGHPILLKGDPAVHQEQFDINF